MHKNISDSKSTPKPGLHPRNPHRFRYDFQVLCQSSPELKRFIQLSPGGEETINFSNAKAVKTLNSALLKHFYELEYWDIPEDYLCPPIPGRADYIHYLADLLAGYNQGVIPEGKEIRVLDIGTGSSCIYPVIGHKSYGWDFVASDVDPKALQSARCIIDKNPSLKGHIKCRQQTNSEEIFTGVIKFKEIFNLTLCNPPFFGSEEETKSANQRKNRNLKIKAKKERNFAGQSHELWYPGGELGFVHKMISESKEYRHRSLWFTTLISSQKHVPILVQALQNANVKAHKVIPMAQGQKSSRILAWTFFNPEEVKQWTSKG